MGSVMGDGNRGDPDSSAHMVMWGGGDTNTGLDNGIWEPGIPILVQISSLEDPNIGTDNGVREVGDPNISLNNGIQALWGPQYWSG